MRFLLQVALLIWELSLAKSRDFLEILFTCFLLVFWEVHTVYFDHFQPSPNVPRYTPSLTTQISILSKPNKSNLLFSYILRFLTFYLCMVNLPGTKLSLKENWLFFFKKLSSFFVWGRISIYTSLLCVEILSELAQGLCI